jgi:signal transduction histidine kinase
LKKQTEKSKQEKLIQDRLIRSERLAATGQLAASIAHEINSPLQGISSLLAAIKRADYKDEKLLRNIDLIEEAFGRIGHTVKNLMDLNRPGKEKKQPVNVNNIVENTAALLRNFLKLKHIHIKTDLQADLPELHASPQQLGQVLMNLCNNAVEAIGSVPRAKMPLQDRPAYEGVIRIETFGSDEAVVVTVTDSGPGFREGEAEKVFDPFYTSKKRMGMGVGLSICYGIVEDHHGTIEINPEIKKGAQLVVTLPLPSGSGTHP